MECLQSCREVVELFGQKESSVKRQDWVMNSWMYEPCS